MFSELIHEVTDWSVLTKSIQTYCAHISFNSVIVTIMMIFMCVGAIDKARGNKLGYGEAFDEGFQAMGPLAIAMVGVIAAAPVLRILLQPIVGPVYELLGSSPSIFATTLLLADSGGYALAVQMAGEDAAMGQFAGIVVGCTMGCVALAVFQYETGIRFPLLYQMVEPAADGVSPLAQSVDILGDIAFVLLGAFPMVEWIKRHFGGALAKVGSRLGMNEAASAGIVATLANNIPTFKMVQDMDPKGKLLNIAFATAAAFMFGDHLGFVAGVNAAMILPMICAKLVCGLTALCLANLLAPRLLAKAASAAESAAG